MLLLQLHLLLILLVRCCVAAADDLDGQDVILLCLHYLVRIIHGRAVALPTRTATAHAWHVLNGLLAAFVTAQSCLPASLLRTLDRPNGSMCGDILYLRISRFASIFSLGLRLSPVLVLNWLLHFLREGLVLKVAFVHALHLKMVIYLIWSVHLFFLYSVSTSFQFECSNPICYIVY